MYTLRKSESHVDQSGVRQINGVCEEACDSADRIRGSVCRESLPKVTERSVSENEELIGVSNVVAFKLKCTWKPEQVYLEVKPNSLARIKFIPNLKYKMRTKTFALKVLTI